ncbi:hypothetical protein TWF694_007769 [Orbilia ellipsospora]|uniref:Uncharacterized protein n=1 Tax=Orbilia ellipsospora TaxID=2528407 RepID=A0AAV9XIU1_9PEZI
MTRTKKNLVAASSLVELVSAMEGGTGENESLLQGWDVLVSYDTDVLNTLLAAQGKTIANIQDVPEFHIDIKSMSGKVLNTQTYNLKLSNITINFRNTSGSKPLMVTFKVTGTIKDKVDETVTNVPDDVYLNVYTTLANVQGTISKDGTFNPGSGTSQGPEWLVTTEPGVHNAVCIDLEQNTDLEADFSSTSDAGKLFVDDSDQAVLNLKKHLKNTAGLGFCLAAVQNTGETLVEGVLALQPTCFMMSLVPAPDGSTGSGALCLWIAVDGGVSAPGNKGGSTKPADLEFKTYDKTSKAMTSKYPIPSGRNASIIFNHSFVKDKLFAAGLTSRGCTYPTLPIANEFNLSFNLPSVKVDVLGFKSPKNDSPQWDIGALSFNISSNPCTMKISPKVVTNDPTAGVPISMTYGTANGSSDWTEEYFNPWAGEPVYEFGTTEMAFDCSGSYTWTQNQNKLTTTANFPSVYTATTVPGGYSVKWGEAWSNQIPEKWKEVSVKIPIPSLEFPSVDTFLVTNLLLPGQKIFTADDIVADVSNFKKVVGGFAIPWDMILTGTIASPTPTLVPAPENTPERLRSKMSRFRPLPMKAGTDNNSNNISLENKFLDTFFSTTDTTMAKDMFASIGTDVDVDPSDAVLDAIAKHGFGEMDADKLGDLLGLSLESEIALEGLTDSDLPPTPAPTDTPEAFSGGFRATFDNTTPTFDLHAYAGVYAVNKVDTDLLIVDPGTAAITYKGATKASTITSNNDTNNPIYTVSWSTGSSGTNDLTTYKIVFSSTPQESGFQQLFTGTVNASNNNSDFNGVKLVPVPKFDVRVAGGRYTVTKPAEYDQAILLVDIVTGEIVFDSERTMPTQNITSDGQTHILWKLVDGTAFDVVFNMGQTGMSFTGKVKDTAGTSSDFVGSIPPDSAPASGRDEWDNFGNGSNVFGTIMNIIQVGTMLYAVIMWTQRKKKANKIEGARKQKMEVLTKMVGRRVVTRKKLVLNHVGTLASRKIDENKAAWKPRLDPQLDAIVKAALTKKIQELQQSKVIHPDAEMPPLTDQVWAQVHDAAKQTLKDSLQVFGRSAIKPFDAASVKLLTELGLTSKNILDATNTAVNNAADGLVSNLAGANFTDPASYVYSMVQSARSAANIEFIKNNRADAVRQSNSLKSDILTIDNTTRTDNARLIELAKLIPTSSGAEKTKYETEKSEIEGRIERNAKDRAQYVGDKNSYDAEAIKLDKDMGNETTEGEKAAKEASRVREHVI